MGGEKEEGWEKEWGGMKNGGGEGVGWDIRWGGMKNGV